MCTAHTLRSVHNIFRQRKTPKKTKPGKFGRKTDKYAVDAVWTEQTIIATLYVIFQTCMCTISLTFLLLRLYSRTSTSCATGQHWSTWGALTTMQHNHSSRAASLVKPLRSVPSVPFQPPSTHLTPLKPDTPTPTPTPPSYRGGGGESDTLSVPATGSTNHRDPH